MAIEKATLTLGLVPHTSNPSDRIGIAASESPASYEYSWDFSKRGSEVCLQRVRWT